MKVQKVIGVLLTVVIVAIFVLDSALILLPNLLGYRCFAVTSPSMEPGIRTGDLVFTKEIAPGDIQTGDVLTFSDGAGGKFFTHRVTRVDTENALIYTKGDANRYGDPTPTSYTYVKGKVVHTVGHLGTVKLFLTSTVGMTVTLLLVAAWLVFEFILVRKRSNHEKA